MVRLIDNDIFLFILLLVNIVIIAIYDKVTVSNMIKAVVTAMSIRIICSYVPNPILAMKIIVAILSIVTLIFKGMVLLAAFIELIQNMQKHHIFGIILVVIIFAVLGFMESMRHYDVYKGGFK